MFLYAVEIKIHEMLFTIRKISPRKKKSSVFVLFSKKTTTS